jgi:allophanate hydrolase
MRHASDIDTNVDAARWKRALQRHTMTLAELRTRYASGASRPTDVISELYATLAREPLHPIWISQLSRESAMARASALERDPLATAKPLYGVPFAIKDNIDLAGLPTTAACPSYAYKPDASATVVQNLIDAGAIPIGKTNMDQFATGLVGTRSPHGACSSVFDARYISGGSSSGSAVAVAKGLAAFSLGTDTAGSGRVPAAFNGLIGLKPTRGLLSTLGVVPACRTLDCVSIFANTAHDAHTVFQAARGFDPLDPYSRTGQTASPWLGGAFRFGVPARNQLEFFGDDEAEALYWQALERIDGTRIEIDFGVFREAANLLYSGPWVAERLAAIGDAATEPTVSKIIAGGGKYTAVDTFKAEYRLRELQRATQAEWSKMDTLVLPTTGTIYTHDEIAADPIARNTNLGYYTNFVNLLDLAAVAVPAGVRSNGLPFGISFIGPAFTDEALLALAGAFTGAPVDLETSPPGCILVAVVGAHLTGQPLNWQLTERGARCVRTCRTAREYRLYALDRTMPPKPGLVREPGFEGPGIEVEVWAVPEEKFGGFVAAVPPPLGIGNAVLEDGSTVKCFVCEPYAVAGAAEITRFGGWRAYVR